ncbi:hypothetical protein [Paenibacillus guangzhouensis]|nr:hypothetical protein [Paenibacillus guangzhouensis]
MAVLNATLKFLLSIALVFLVIAFLPAFLITDDISLFQSLFDILFHE